MKKKNRRIKIAVDTLGINFPGGARTAVLFLFEQVVRERPNWDFVFYLSESEPSLVRENVTQVILPFHKGIIARIFMQIYLPFDLLFRKADLIHFTKSQASWVWKTKKVFTIFDMTTLLYPEQFSNFTVWYWKHIQGKLANFVDAVVTISHNAAKDIARYYNVHSESIHVIHLSSQFQEVQSISLAETEAIKNKFCLPNTYILYVGLLALKKNLDTVIYAMQALNDTGERSHNLVLVGPQYLSSDASNILDLVERLGLSESIKYLGIVSQKDLQIIFSQAQCLLLPSIHEGFGITALEAMQLGMPVIASKAGAIPEVVGDAALLIEDCLNPGAWAKEILLLSKSETTRLELIQKGKRKAAGYSWVQAAKELINIYSDLLDLHKLN